MPEESQLLSYNSVGLQSLMYLFYIRTQFIPRSQHSPIQL